jgi:hypothetical protein
MMHTQRSPQDSRTAPAASLGAPLALVALALAGVLLAPAAAADWLVLHDGSRVETRGAWEVKGRQIVFHLADGKLSSLKTDQVDLEASRQATRAASEARSRPEPTAEPEPEPQAPRRKWTNADIPRGTPPQASNPASASGDEEGSGGARDGEGERNAGAGNEQAAPGVSASAAEEGTAPAGQTGDVAVAAWDRRERSGGDGLEIYGTVRNKRAGTVATGVRVTVVLYDRGGEQIGERAADVSPSTLQDGGSAEFVASFPDVYDFGAVRFNATSLPIDVSEGEPPSNTSSGGGQPNT